MSISPIIIQQNTLLSYGVQMQGGKLLISGHSNHQPVIARFGTDLTLDKSFGKDGAVVAQTSMNSDSIFRHIGLLASGKILALGYTMSSNLDCPQIMVRFDANGIPVPGFEAGMAYYCSAGEGAMYLGLQKITGQLTILTDKSLRRLSSD